MLGATVWVTAGTESAPAILAVDTATGKAGRRIFGVDGPVVFDGKLWVSENGVPSVVDAKTDRTRPTDGPIGSVMWASAPAGGLSWMSNGVSALGVNADGTLWRVDPTATEATRALRLANNHTMSIVGDGLGGVWIALAEESRLEH